MTNLNILVRARSAVRVAARDPSFGGAAYGGMTHVGRSRQLHPLLESLLVKDRDAALEAALLR